MAFDMKIEVVFIGVTDVDRAKDFYVNKLGFHADHDQTVSDEVRFVQLTPQGSACSLAFGKGISPMQPGEAKNVMMVVDDVAAVHADLKEKGVDVTDLDHMQWGTFAYFKDPDGNAWTLQELPKR